MRHVCHKLAVVKSSSWGSSLVRVAIRREALPLENVPSASLCGKQSVPTTVAEALVMLLGQSSAHLQGMFVVTTFSRRWVVCEKAS